MRKLTVIDWETIQTNLKEIWNLWAISKILKKNMIALVYSSTMMSNVSGMQLKEWVVAFWKEGRLTP